MKLIRVALALCWREDGCLLVTRRPAGAHQGGLLEFPGGKIEEGEEPAQAALRELREETGLVAHSAGTGRAVMVHAYDDRRVELHPIDCVVRGDPGVLQLSGVTEAFWRLPSQLQPDDFPAANVALLEALRRQPLSRV